MVISQVKEEIKGRTENWMKKKSAVNKEEVNKGSGQ